MRNFFKSIAPLLKHELFWLALAVTAVMLQAVYAAYHMDVSLDEGAYAYKGYLFLTGRYQPYQDYGPWVNKMPLSFLIPGAVQLIFGLGLRTSRHYALVLLLLMLIGLWLTARRYSGRRVATGLIAFIGLNPLFIALYSQGFSQVLVACMLTWVLELTLGKDRKAWQLAAGMFLAGLIVVTRENMAPVPVLLGLYLVWEHGLRRVWPALLASLASIGTVHIIFWPEILRHWLSWFPFPLPWFKPAWGIRMPGSYSMAGLTPTLFDRIFAFSHTVYVQVPLWVSVMAGWLLWPSARNESYNRVRKELVFLSFTFLLLTVMHAAASVGGSYCILCLESYMGFFAPLGWLLAAILFPVWQKKLGWIRQVLVFAAFLLFSMILGFGSAPATAPLLLNLQVPRMRDLRILPGMLDLWRLLSNRFQWTYDLQKYLLPTIAAAGVFILVALLILALFLLRKKKVSFSPGYALSLLLLIVIVSFSTLQRLETATNQPQCTQDMIQIHEQIGAYLVRLIPPGSTVYWKGAPIIDLLYIPKAEIFPPQLNQQFSFRFGGDPDTLNRFGFWNQELADQWMQTADYLVVEQSSLTDALVSDMQAANYRELPHNPPVFACNEGVILRVFIHDK